MTNVNNVTSCLTNYHWYWQTSLTTHVSYTSLNNCWHFACSTIMAITMASTALQAAFLFTNWQYSLSSWSSNLTFNYWRLYIHININRVLVRMISNRINRSFIGWWQYTDNSPTRKHRYLNLDHRKQHKHGHMESSPNPKKDNCTI